MTVLRGALLVDGTGAPPRPADVVIEADRIAAVEAPGTASGTASGDGEVVDLDGLVLAPGFIDCHTHYDAQVLWDPDLTPSSWHGVTTVVMGNCGFGIAPTRPSGRETIARTLENVEGMSVEALFAGIPWTFETFPEYLDAVERAGPKLNVAVMLGHTPLRLYVLGEEAAERDATSAEIEEMRRLVGEALDAGAIGFASSRQPAHAGAWGKPVPSRLATVDELMRLAEPLAERGRGTFAITHGPDFGPVELAELSVKTGRPVTWTALNASPGAFRLLDKAEARGGEVWPQVACRPIVFQVTLAEPAPFARADAFAQVLSVPAAERSRFYRDPAWRERARADVVRQWHYGWDKVFVAETAAHPELADGPSLAELGAQRGVDPLDVLCDVALDDDLRDPVPGRGRQRRCRLARRAAPGRPHPARACPTRARTPASSATRSSPPTCWSTGSGRPARCRWRRPSGGSPGTRPRSSGSPAGAASRPGTSPTWSRSIPPRSGWSGWSGSGTCRPARTGSSPAATGCTRSGSTASWPVTATAARGPAASSATAERPQAPDPTTPR